MEGTIKPIFIASAAFPDPADYAAAKISIFVASLAAAGVGVLILWRQAGASGEPGGREGT